MANILYAQLVAIFIKFLDLGKRVIQSMAREMEKPTPIYILASS